jgi:hypothetical protein
MTRRFLTLLLGLCVAGPMKGSSANAANTGKGRYKVWPARFRIRWAVPWRRPGVSLQADNGKVVAKTRTEANGRFSFHEVYPGTYAVMVTKQSFKPAVKVATVGSGRPTELTLTMASHEALSLAVVAKRLDVARNSEEAFEIGCPAGVGLGAIVGGVVGAVTYKESVVTAQPPQLCPRPHRLLLRLLRLSGSFFAVFISISTRPISGPMRRPSSMKPLAYSANMPT